VEPYTEAELHAVLDQGDGGFGGGTLPLVRGPHQSPLS
jgi:hypothetical protein